MNHKADNKLYSKYWIYALKMSFERVIFFHKTNAHITNFYFFKRISTIEWSIMFQSFFNIQIIQSTGEILPFLFCNIIFVISIELPKHTHKTKNGNNSQWCNYNLRHLLYQFPLSEISYKPSSCMINVRCAITIMIIKTITP